MKWFFPSWNGDVRAESVEGDAALSRLTIIKPTLGEQRALEALDKALHKNGWRDSPGTGLWNPKGADTQHVDIATPLKKLGPVLARAFKPGKQTLTAIKLSGGKIETVTGSETTLDEVAEAKIEKAEVAATVKRATPCCPQCMPGAVEPATEVLLSFLTPAQHTEWAAERLIVVRGGQTGHRYLLAHRHTERARRMGRICFDLDDELVIHFHDHSVPPEEEVLGAKLVLEHMEPWLRNDATVFMTDQYGNFKHPHNAQYFENPLGPGIMDGTGDACVTRAIGGALLGYVGRNDLVVGDLQTQLDRAAHQ